MEKFDPNDSKYEKVTDLPKEEQKNFVDVEGGFVRQKALETYCDAKIEAIEYTEDRIQELINNVIEIVSGESESRKLKALEILQGQAIRLPETEKKHELEYIEASFNAIISEYLDSVVTEVIYALEKPIKDQLKKHGHEGLLRWKNYRYADGSGGWSRLVGFIDGETVNFSPDDDGSSEIMEIYGGYAPSTFYYNYINKLVVSLKEAIEETFTHCKEVGPDTSNIDSILKKIRYSGLPATDKSPREFRPQIESIPFPEELLIELAKEMSSVKEEIDSTRGDAERYELSAKKEEQERLNEIEREENRKKYL